jgi:hypothetical protein
LDWNFETNYVNIQSKPAPSIRQERIRTVFMKRRWSYGNSITDCQITHQVKKFPRGSLWVNSKYIRFAAYGIP